MNGVNLTYVCPPDGYNGFDRSQGSYCESTPQIQLWATFSNYESKAIHSIRVVLSNSFPDVASLQANAPPFGTAVFNFPDGIDVRGGIAAAVNEGEKTLLAICQLPPTSSGDQIVCPALPDNPNLNVQLTSRSYGYFGSDLVENAVIPGWWNQLDSEELLSGITSPSMFGGLQDFYFNKNGFYLHAVCMRLIERARYRLLTNQQITRLMTRKTQMYLTACYSRQLL